MPEESVVIRCESCNQKIWIPPQHLGDAGRCPKCKTPFEPVQTAEFGGGRRAARRTNIRRIIAGTCWAYLAGILLAAGILHGLSEAWAINSVLLFAPRWLLLLPLVVLLPAALFSWKGALPPLALSFPVYLFLVAGLAPRWHAGDRQAAPDSVRLITVNTGGGQLNLGRLKKYIEETQADVVVLQEWGERNRVAVFGDKERSPWTVVQSGGVWVASRLPVTAEKGLAYGQFELPGTLGIFEIAAPGQTFRLGGVHLPTAREGLEAVIAWRLKGLPVLRANAEGREQASLVARRLINTGDPALIVAGDYNMPPESSIVKQYWGDLTEAFQAAGIGFGHTKHTRWHGVRIDQIRFGAAWTCSYCEVGPYVGSDHLPVFAVLAPRAVAGTK